jgi:outer membrane lipoprotein carrier protein
MRQSSRILLVFSIILFRPVWTQDIADIRSRIKGLDSSFTANFSYSSNTGEIYTGKIFYEYPNKLNIQLSNGSVIASNGKYLWVFDSHNNVCSRQNVKEGEETGGLFFFLQRGYLVREDNGRYIFNNPDFALSEVSLKIEDSFLKNVQFKIKDSVINVSFSNVIINTSIKASLFNYKPGPDTQLIENPLNKIGGNFIQ